MYFCKQMLDCGMLSDAKTVSVGVFFVNCVGHPQSTLWQYLAAQYNILLHVYLIILCYRIHAYHPSTFFIKYNFSYTHCRVHLNTSDCVTLYIASMFHFMGQSSNYKVNFSTNLIIRVHTYLLYHDSDSQTLVYRHFADCAFANHKGTQLWFECLQYTGCIL